MNPIEAAIRRADRAQQRHGPPGFVFGVIKKFGDDNGGVLVTNLAYCGFVSLFPLLLILVTILGLVASADPALKQDVLNAVATQVPLIGQQLTGNVHELRQSSIIGLIVGVAVLIWGTSRLAQAGIFTMEQVWNLPGPARPGYVPRLIRCATFLAVLGLGVIATTLLAALDAFGRHSVPFVVASEALAAVVNAGMYLVGFRVLTPAGISLRKLVPGAIAGGVAWTVLQVIGTYLVRHSVHTAAAYGVFATVLGLLAWVYLAVEVTVYAAEVNVVLARRLWPRSVVQPPLTEADRASMALQALQNQRRAEQQVEVTFSDRPAGTGPHASTPRWPEDVLGRQEPAAGPPEAGPSETAPSGAAPAEAGPSEAGPSEAGPPEATPAEAGPAGKAPPEGGRPDRGPPG
jgi:YihY family inner membrane protein